MISLRRHVLTIAAVFLALALGVVLGATSVATSIRDSLVDDRETTAAQLDRTTAERDEATRAADRLDGAAGTLRPAVTAGTLKDRPVLVLVAPGAGKDAVGATVDAVKAAGGTDAGTVTLTDKAVDPAADAELQALVANLPVGTAPPADADLGTVLGTALGRAALLRPEDGKPQIGDRERETVFTTLADAGVISYDRGTVRPGQLALVVAGPEAGADGVVGSRLASLARTLDGLGSGTLVTAPLDAGARGDVVSLLRSAGDTGVSTVDDPGSESGRLAVVLGLAEQLARKSGHYGLRPDASAAVPAPPSR